MGQEKVTKLYFKKNMPQVAAMGDGIGSGVSQWLVALIGGGS